MMTRNKKRLVVEDEDRVALETQIVVKDGTEKKKEEAPEVDVGAINKRKQKRLAKVIADEDQGLNNFGISRKIQKIMAEQQKRKKDQKIVSKG